LTAIKIDYAIKIGKTAQGAARPGLKQITSTAVRNLSIVEKR